MTGIVGPPILTRRAVLLFLAASGAMTSFYLLLSVVPLYVAGNGAGGVGAGLATGAMMLSTVLTELATPHLLARFGHRSVLGLGLILLGAPAVALAATSALPVVLAVCLARGAGLATVVVAGTALVAEVVPAERRAEGLGLYGVAVGIPAVVGLPLGLWMSEHTGFGPVFFAGAAVSLVALAAVAGLPVAVPQTGRTERLSTVLSGPFGGGIARPAVIFAAITFAAGVVVTFVPLAVASGRVAEVALLVQSALAPAARLIAGRFGDRHGSGRLLVPAVLAVAAGTLGLAWLDSPLAIVAGLALFGIGFGTAQNVTLALMFDHVPGSAFGRVSALWNLAYDAGMGAGAVGVGLVVGPIGYPASFVVTASVVVFVLAAARCDVVVKKGVRRGHDR
jgi:MFS family permease